MDDFGASAPLHADVRLIAHDLTGLLALAKPAGVLSHPNAPADHRRSLLTCRYSLQEECYEWLDQPSGATRRAWLLNRLDSGTSGLLMLAESAELARHLREHFRTRRVQKIYAAVVFGRPPGSRSIWKDRLGVSKQGGQVRTTPGGNIPAETAMQSIQTAMTEFGVLSLLQLEPRTGRSHQLRVQCAKRQLPIVGDATYGDFRRNRAFAKATDESRLHLHSFRTRFSFQWQGARHEFLAEAPLPGAFSAALTSR